MQAQGEDEGAGPSSWESDTHHYAPHEEEERNGVEEAQTTPELSAQPSLDSPPTMKFFPLFRPKSQWKVGTVTHFSRQL